MTKNLTLEIQNDDVGEAVRARYTMTASIIRAMLYSTNREMVKALGGAEQITLEQLARVKKVRSQFSSALRKMER